MSHTSATLSRKSRRTGFWTTLRTALTLNASFYDKAHNTRRNRRLAFDIVLLAAVSHTLGSAAILLLSRITGWALALALLVNGLSVMAGYYVWTFVIWKVGQWLKPIDPTYPDLLSPIGFAYAPQALNFLTLIPLLGRPIELILGVWSLLAAIVAVRQGLDIPARQASFICLIGWTLIQIAIGFIQISQQQLFARTI
jgi:hypothetical protein